MGKNNGFCKALKAAFPLTLPVLTGYAVLGIAYGILMASKGYGALWSLLTSALAFCGSMQYAAITLLTGAFEPLQAFVLSLMVNARHLFYGISMLQKYKGTGRVKFFLIYLLSDETFSLTSSLAVPSGTEPRLFYLAVSLLDYAYWVLGSFLGGLAGSLITFNIKGLDFALTALFVVLFIEQVKSKRLLAAGLIGVGAAVIGTVLFGSNMVIPAMVIILAVLLLFRRAL